MRDARLDKLGNPQSPKLFEAPRDALEAWAMFARVVDKATKADSLVLRQAREALTGEWKRLRTARSTS